MKTDTSKLRPSLRKIANQEEQEFNTTVQEMIAAHPKTEISFNQFMVLLAKFDIKFYSPEEFKKMSRVFNNTFHVLPTNVPFGYLELHSKQAAGPLVYFLVRILHKKVDIYTNDSAKLKAPHSVDKCMGDFVVLMRKRYGNEINWFKVLGGMTVAVSIQVEVFRGNLSQIMRNTSHHRCIEQIMNVFLEPPSKIITWQQFMTVIKANIKKITEGIRSKSRKSFQESIMHEKAVTEPSDPYLTVKSKFFHTENSKVDERPNSHSLRKQNNFSRSVYGTKRFGGDQKKFFGSRCRTEGTEELDLKLSMHQCPIYSKAKTSVSFAEGKDTAYPMKKHTISLPINEKRMQRSNFLWKYLKTKIQQQ